MPSSRKKRETPGNHVNSRRNSCRKTAEKNIGGIDSALKLNSIPTKGQVAGKNAAKTEGKRESTENRQNSPAIIEDHIKLSVFTCALALDKLDRCSRLLDKTTERHNIVYNNNDWNFTRSKRHFMNGNRTTSVGAIDSKQCLAIQQLKKLVLSQRSYDDLWILLMSLEPHILERMMMELMELGRGTAFLIDTVKNAVDSNVDVCSRNVASGCPALVAAEARAMYNMVLMICAEREQFRVAALNSPTALVLVEKEITASPTRHNSSNGNNKNESGGRKVSSLHHKDGVVHSPSISPVTLYETQLNQFLTDSLDVSLHSKTTVPDKTTLSELQTRFPAVPHSLCARGVNGSNTISKSNIQKKGVALPRKRSSARKRARCSYSSSTSSSDSSISSCSSSTTSDSEREIDEKMNRRAKSSCKNTGATQKVLHRGKPCSVASSKKSSCLKEPEKKYFINMTNSEESIFVL